MIPDGQLWRAVYATKPRNHPHCHSWGERPRAITDDLQMDISEEQSTKEPSPLSLVGGRSRPVTDDLQMDISENSMLLN